MNDIKEYFNNIGYNRSSEANALKEQINGEIHYIQSIIDAFDKIAESAVNNYQTNFTVEDGNDQYRSWLPLLPHGLPCHNLNQ